MNRIARVKMFFWRIFHSRLGNFLAVVNLFAIAIFAASFRGVTPNIFGAASLGLFIIVNLPVFSAYFYLGTLLVDILDLAVFKVLAQPPFSLPILCFGIYLQWAAIGCFIETNRTKQRARREARIENFAFDAAGLPVAKTFLDLPEAFGNQISEACPLDFQNLKTAKLDISHYRRVYK